MTLAMAVNVAKWAAVSAVCACLIALMAVIIVPRALGWQGVIILSGSMEPALHTGGIAFIEKVNDPKTIKTGDVITRVEPALNDSRVTHRVIEVVDGPDGIYFRTKGDANKVADANLVPAGAVVGKVRWDVPYLGRVIDSLKHRENYYIIVGIPAALLVMTELWSIGKELKKPQVVREDGSNEVAS